MVVKGNIELEIDTMRYFSKYSSYVIFVTSKGMLEAFNSGTLFSSTAGAVCFVSISLLLFFFSGIFSS
jgi:hypothetical protein